MIHSVQILNCNNIKEGSINIESNKLNIKYGINGTGKTTIANAIRYSLEGDKIHSLQSYYSADKVSVNITPQFNKILVFNEEFVNQVVFVENEVIENSFEVFLKTPNYEEKKSKLDEHLKTLREIAVEDNEILSLKSKLISINEKFNKTSTGKISTSGVLKSLLSKQNLYNIPTELESYRPFIENSENNISWIEWVNKGATYDNIEFCPYCSETLSESHSEKIEIFNKTYKKKDSQNLKEILEQIQELKEYMSNEKYIDIIKYIKTETPEDIIKSIVYKLKTELELIIDRFNAIGDFGKKNIALTNIADIEQEISNMEIPIDLLDIFKGDKILTIFSKINDKITQLKGELNSLKKELGELKGLLLATIDASQSDINAFLATAGINYEIEIDVEDESNSRTILKQCFSEEKTNVQNIREHLSWGEKNAFSLILFMYYANMQNADLIILDDPISSFDSNKKYAILHRMFKSIGKQQISLSGRTVLLLTHDFEPVTDFIVVGKLSEEKAVASFVCNQNGILKEQDIVPEQDVFVITKEYSDIARNNSINIISRVAFLRKLCELNGRQGNWNEAYEILSCLIHASDIKRKIANGIYLDMAENEINIGLEKILEFIPDFDYEKLKNNVYTISGIIDLYKNEKNAYLKIQLFRALCEISGDKIQLNSFDDGWYKFIDQTYHIENDYLHFLDILKFNIVPYYILEKADTIIDKYF